MTWVRLEDTMTEHPKVAGLPDSAFRMHIHAICYSARHLTDGVIPCHVSVKLLAVSRPSRVRQYLLDAGLWVSLPNGDYLIHDYLDYNPSKADVERDREHARTRKRRQRYGDSHAVTPPVTPPTSHAVSHGGSHAPPSPTLVDKNSNQEDPPPETLDLASFGRLPVADPVGRLIATAIVDHRTEERARRIIATRGLSQSHVEQIREELASPNIRSKGGYLIKRLRTIEAKETA